MTGLAHGYFGWRGIEGKIGRSASAVPRLGLLWVQTHRYICEGVCPACADAGVCFGSLHSAVVVPSFALDLRPSTSTVWPSHARALPAETRRRLSLPHPLPSRPTTPLGRPIYAALILNSSHLAAELGHRPAIYPLLPRQTARSALLPLTTQLPRCTQAIRHSRIYPQAFSAAAGLLIWPS